MTPPTAVGKGCDEQTDVTRDARCISALQVPESMGSRLHTATSGIDDTSGVGVESITAAPSNVTLATSPPASLSLIVDVPSLEHAPAPNEVPTKVNATIRTGDSCMPTKGSSPALDPPRIGAPVATQI